MAEGWRSVFPEAEVVEVPVSDGGDEFTISLAAATGGRTEEVAVTGPLGEEVRARLGILGDGRTGVIEMAEASGLVLVPDERRNPEVTTTYCTGELIRKALDLGCTTLYVGIGGSATNDGGVGMAQALGARFLDAGGQEVGRGGAQLSRIERIDLSGLDPRLADATVKVACDVDNPLTGPSGAAAIYGPQKGATPEMIDWWWVNMEKGYPLWEPNDHKSFIWEVPPPVGGYLGAIQIAEEKMGPMPPMKIRIRWDDPDSCPIPRIYEHAIVASGVNPEGKVGAMILHEWEKSPRGTRMRSTMRFPGPVPPGFAEIWKAHDRAEVSTFPNFLPDLYRLWQSVKDPAINRQCSLKVKQNPS
jgi:hypothetical protein